MELLHVARVRVASIETEFRSLGEEKKHDNLFCNLSIKKPISTLEFIRNLHLHQLAATPHNLIHRV